jgi:hypothetical protein
MHGFRQANRCLASNGGRMKKYGARCSHSLSLLVFCLLLDIWLSISSRSYLPTNPPERWFNLGDLEFTYLPTNSFQSSFFMV